MCKSEWMPDGNDGICYIEVIRQKYISIIFLKDKTTPPPFLLDGQLSSSEGNVFCCHVFNNYNYYPTTRVMSDRKQSSA